MSGAVSYQAMALAYPPAANGSAGASRPSNVVSLSGHRWSSAEDGGPDMLAAASAGMVDIDAVEAAAPFHRQVLGYLPWRDTIAFPMASMIVLAPHLEGAIRGIFGRICRASADPGKASPVYYAAGELVLTNAVRDQRSGTIKHPASPHAYFEAALAAGWDGRTDTQRQAALAAQQPSAAVTPSIPTTPATPTAPAGLGFFSPVLFDTTHLTRVPWLVHGLAVAGDISVIAAPGGGAKTVAAIDLLVCIAAGRTSWHGFRITLCADGRSHQVALITAEEALARIALMVAAACQAHRLSPVERAAVAANLMVHDARASGIRIGEPRGRGEDICPETEDRACLELRGALAGVSLVVLDTLAATFALPNENDNSAATTLMRRLGAVMAATGCAAILLHHTPKLTREAAAGLRGDPMAVRGAGAIVNSARIAWTITGLPAAEAGLFAIVGANVAALRRLDPVKLNDAPPPDPVFFEVTSERVRIADGSDVPVRAIQAITQPIAAAGAIPAATLNTAMRAIDAGTTFRGVPGIPLSPAAGGDRAAVPRIADALRAADPTLPETHARTAARDVLAHLIGHLGCVSETTVQVPKFKKGGSRNGTDPGKGLVAHWHLAPWAAAPVPPATSAVPLSAAVAPLAQTPSPAAPATTATP